MQLHIFEQVLNDYNQALIDPSVLKTPYTCHALTMAGVDRENKDLYGKYLLSTYPKLFTEVFSSVLYVESDKGEFERLNFEPSARNHKPTIELRIEFLSGFIKSMEAK